MTDNELIEKIVKGNNTHLFAVLYDRYSSVVYSKCLSFVKSKEIAEDLTHDLFVELFVKIKTYKGEAKFSTWLYSFTYNFCVNYIQRDKYKKNEKISDDLEASFADIEEIDDALIFEIKATKLKLILDKIDPEYKMILLMKYQDDMTIKELSILLGVSKSAVKMRLNRAKKKALEISNFLDL
ncbi:RNA polymerase sigma factor [Wenyingzhuangia sp. 2_MG-2023]|uniref:RNA polymerase sigma factor n=1 Tax=Wenyingzhuangia sp. 2_MG-2023 TaxID=3062639 RepID=UPI0026E488D0|nr:sigma-70 family RNA polymerase sigma factor [Wenyingzhuangia sp. 2_MG-2023]MDO6738053.1 sigma-70 family RNA polymerase sigma factor [Wenyingzhuangia sp. 2_MG-2023]MDO6802593.1 sigma-70 family RNA polymerase sigma factor [Wenyingzhuangia sp. 1_MG-2023]